MAKPSTPKSQGNAGGGTPATVALTKAGVPFTVHQFDNAVAPGDHGYGKAAATALGVDEARVFKTLLVTVHGGGGQVSHAVGVVPVSGQLSLKSMAAALGAKRVEMLEPSAAERLTGYVVGGISPFGQKKRLPTVVDETANTHTTVFVSGGKRGLDLEVAPAHLISTLSAVVAPIAD